MATHRQRGAAWGNHGEGTRGVLGQLVGGAAEPKRVEATGAPPTHHHQVGGDLVGEAQQCRRRRTRQLLLNGPRAGCRVGDAGHDHLGTGRSRERVCPGTCCGRARRPIVTHQHS